jgi:hypothetical protein
LAIAVAKAATVPSRATATRSRKAMGTPRTRTRVGGQQPDRRERDEGHAAGHEERRRADPGRSVQQGTRGEAGHHDATYEAENPTAVGVGGRGVQPALDDHVQAGRRTLPGGATPRTRGPRRPAEERHDRDRAGQHAEAAAEPIRRRRPGVTRAGQEADVVRRETCRRPAPNPACVDRTPNSVSRRPLPTMRMPTPAIGGAAEVASRVPGRSRWRGVGTGRHPSGYAADPSCVPYRGTVPPRRPRPTGSQARPPPRGLRPAHRRSRQRAGVWRGSVSPLRRNRQTPMGRPSAALAAGRSTDYWTGSREGVADPGQSGRLPRREATAQVGDVGRAQLVLQQVGRERGG